MSAFFGQEFLTAQYFRPNYLHGTGGTPPTQSGRSGYWRLFYTQLQEEALKKDEKTVEHTGSMVVTETVHDKVAAPKKLAKKKVPAHVTPEVFVPPDLPTFKRTPVYTTPSIYEQVQQLIALDPVPYTKARHNSRERITKQRKQRARRRAAAFLLLAA